MRIPYLTLYVYLLVPLTFQAQCTSNGNGNWTNGANWTGCAGPGGIPAATDNVIIDGHQITINTNQTCASLTFLSAGSNLTQLDVTANSLSITSNLQFTQSNGGNDERLHIDGAAIVNVGGGLTIDQNNGDDIEIYINDNSGTNAQLNVTGNFTIDKDGADDIRIRVDNASSLFSVGGGATNRSAC